MKKIIVSYANDLYKKSQLLLSDTALNIGMVNDSIMYDDKWLHTTDFYKNSKRNQYILNQRRGNGFFMWKPFIILNAFKELEDGDVVLYSDAGVKVIGNLNPLFEVAQSDPNGGRVIFKLPAVGVPHHLARTWTKRDCFILMGCDEEKYWNANMSNGAVSLWMKTPENIKFLEEWLQIMRDPRVVTDDTNMCGKPNLLEFRDHRHDQSVLSLLAIKYNFIMYRDPTQFGNEELNQFTNSPYEQLFHHHRNFNQ